MGIFGRIGTYVGKKVEQQKRVAEQRKYTAEQETKERQEVETARKLAFKKERIRMAPSLAKQQVQIEIEQKLTAAKAGKTGGFAGLNLGSIQNLAHNIGQSTGAGFNRDFDMMFGGGAVAGGGKGRQRKSIPYGSSIGYGGGLGGYDIMTGKPVQQKAKPKAKHKKR